MDETQLEDGQLFSAPSLPYLYKLYGQKSLYTGFEPEQYLDRYCNKKGYERIHCSHPECLSSSIYTDILLDMLLLQARKIVSDTCRRDGRADGTLYLLHLSRTFLALSYPMSTRMIHCSLILKAFCHRTTTVLHGSEFRYWVLSTILDYS